MYRMLILVLCLLVVGIGLPAQNSRSYLQPFDYYIPDFEEIGRALAMLELLSSPTEPDLTKLLNWYWGNGDLLGLLLRSYLYHSDDPEVRSLLTAYLGKNNIQDDYSRAIMMKYSSLCETSGEGSQEKVRYNYQNEYFDEDIDLSGLQTIVPYEGLNITTFASRWGYFYLTDLKTGKRLEDLPVGMMAGGDTNTLSLHYSRSEAIQEDQFVQTVNSEIAKGWNAYEVTQLGVYQKACFDRAVMLLDKSDDALYVMTYYYRRDLCTMYTVMYSVLFSPASMTYCVREQIYKLVVLVSTLVYHD